MAVAELIDQVEKLTVLELNELVKALEEKWGVSAAAPVAVAAAGGTAGAAPAAAAEKTEFDAVLTEIGRSRSSRSFANSRASVSPKPKRSLKAPRRPSSRASRATKPSRSKRS
jgi:hypothetical protein